MRLEVNPIACEAHGMCAELLPERIALDEWGYPIVDEKPLSADLIEHARRAAESCPTFALLLHADASRRSRDGELRARRQLAAGREAQARPRMAR